MRREDDDVIRRLIRQPAPQITAFRHLSVVEGPVAGREFELRRVRVGIGERHRADDPRSTHGGGRLGFDPSHRVHHGTRAGLVTVESTNQDQPADRRHGLERRWIFKRGHRHVAPGDSTGAHKARLARQRGDRAELGIDGGRERRGDDNRGKHF